MCAITLTNKGCIIVHTPRQETRTNRFVCSCTSKIVAWKDGNRLDIGGHCYREAGCLCFRGWNRGLGAVFSLEPASVSGMAGFHALFTPSHPRRQVVINSRRNNRTAEGTSKMANTETARRLFQANDCLFFDAAKNAKNVRNAPTPLFFFIIFATFAIEGKRMERGIGLDESF